MSAKLESKMLAFSTLGFFSVSRKGEDEFHVCSLAHQDLANLIEAAGLDKGIIYLGDVDYDYRIIVDKEDYLKCQVALAESVDYSNFRDAIQNSPDQQDKSSFYLEIWALMYDYHIQRSSRKDLRGINEIFEETAEKVFNGNFPFNESPSSTGKYLSDWEGVSALSKKDWEDFERFLAKESA
jgi:hypothetical protein